jgi:hypothetical protein
VFALDQHIAPPAKAPAVSQGKAVQVPALSRRERYPLKRKYYTISVLYQRHWIFRWMCFHFAHDFAQIAPTNHEKPNICQHKDRSFSLGLSVFAALGLDLPFWYFLDKYSIAGPSAECGQD